MRAEPLGGVLPNVYINQDRLLWLIVLGGAVIIRLMELGSRPLDPDEARMAMDAFRGLGFGRQWASPEAASPGYVGLISVLFFWFGSSDAAARLVSAVAGITVVALTWFTSSLLGSRSALGVAALLAASPILIESSRSALSSSTLGCVLFMFVLAGAHVLAALVKTATPPQGWSIVLGASFAAGLATDATFALQILGLGAAAIFAFDVNILRLRFSEARRMGWSPVVLGFVLTMGLYTTRFLTNPGGIQSGLVDALWVWSGDFLQPGRIPLVPVSLLIGSEPLVLVCALAGAIRVSRGTALERFSAAWAAIAFGIAVVSGRGESRFLVPAIIPGALVGGPWLARLTTLPIWRERPAYIVAAAAAAPLIAAFVASLPALRNSTPPALPILLAGLAGLAGSVIGAYALVGRQATLYGCLAMVLGFAGLGTILSSSRLAAASESDLGRITSGFVFTPDFREVENQLAIWEWDQDRRTISVDERLKGPLGWALRSNRSVRWTPPEDIRGGLAIKLASTRADTLPDGGLRVTVGYRTTAFAELTPIRLAEWSFWRRSVFRVEPYDILLFR
ncbi:MAG: hypothetical protein ACKVVP_00740 [Chloroflexota bacterium]